ncbi:MAG: hypothetical protein FWF02_05355 [Micrococcales bacterium]|nr:hypothetical protein [Micrococcales bacterium]MCL2667119.1 hypothetical protein [Micrococcales bacterium]
MTVDKEAVALVTGRSSKYLRAIALLVAATLLLVTVVMLFVEAQQSQIRHNLTDNQNVHVIGVTYRSGGDEPRSLDFNDADNVWGIVRAAVKTDVKVTTYVTFPFGIEADDGQTYFIDGFVGDDVSWLLGQPAPADGGMLSTTTEGTINLQVPVIANEDGGFSSDQTVDVAVPLTRSSGQAPIDVFRHRAATTLAADETAFGTIVSTALSTSWEDFVTAYDSDANPYGFTAVDSVFVYVDDLADVVPAAGAIEAQGFDATYTLEAFDNLASTANAATYVAVGILVVSLVAGTVLILINARSYLRLARRDIGVLVHSGYERSFIAARYRARLVRVFLVAAVPAVIVAVAGSFLFLGENRWLVAVNVAAVAVLLTSTYVIIGYYMLRKNMTLPVLTLLKHEREFS